MAEGDLIAALLDETSRGVAQQGTAGLGGVLRRQRLQGGSPPPQCLTVTPCGVLPRPRSRRRPSFLPAAIDAGWDG